MDYLLKKKNKTFSSFNQLRINTLILMLLLLSSSIFAQKNNISLDSLNNKVKKVKNFDEAYKQKNTVISIDASSWTKEQLDKINEFKALQRLRIWVGYSKQLYLPASLNQLPNLRSIEISSNEIKEFPIILSSVKTLESLYLGYTDIKSLPEDVSDLKHLKELFVPKSLPFEEKMRLWKALPLCKINKNDIKGLHCGKHKPWVGYFSSIEEAMKYPDKVKIIRICNHKDLESLEKLKAFNNLEKLIFYDIFMKKIPEKLYDLTTIKYLMISKCRVEEIPDGISKLKNLKTFTFSTNNFKKFPKDFCKLKNLEELYLEECKFEEVPKDIGKLKKLRILAFGIPNGDNMGTSVTPIKELPQSLYKLKNLERLCITYTNINTIPTEDLKKLPKLKVLEINADLRYDDKFVEQLKKKLPNCRIE